MPLSGVIRPSPDYSSGHRRLDFVEVACTPAGKIAKRESQLAIAPSYTVGIFNTATVAVSLPDRNLKGLGRLVTNRSFKLRKLRSGTAGRNRARFVEVTLGHV